MCGAVWSCRGTDRGVDRGWGRDMAGVLGGGHVGRLADWRLKNSQHSTPLAHDRTEQGCMSHSLVTHITRPAGHTSYACVTHTHHTPADHAHHMPAGHPPPPLPSICRVAAHTPHSCRSHTPPLLLTRPTPAAHTPHPCCSHAPPLLLTPAPPGHPCAPASTRQLPRWLGCPAPGPASARACHGPHADQPCRQHLTQALGRTPQQGAQVGGPYSPAGRAGRWAVLPSRASGCKGSCPRFKGL